MKQRFNAGEILAAELLHGARVTKAQTIDNKAIDWLSQNWLTNSTDLSVLQERDMENANNNKEDFIKS